ncbi:MAG: DsbA family protein [Terriglobia bacterium]
MARKLLKYTSVLAGLWAVSFATYAAQQRHAARRGVDKASLQDTVTHFIREKFGLPDTVKMTPEPLEDSPDPEFYQGVIQVDNGKAVKPQPISVSKNGRYVALGHLYSLGADTSDDIIQTIRQTFHIPPAMVISVGPFRPSPISSFYITTITGDTNGKKQSTDFFVSKDKHYLLLGAVYTVMSRSEILHIINTHDQPYSGGSDAPVTIVEYADLECPACARVQAFLEGQLVPKYGNKVRLIYKEFPLPMHDWSRQAAIANECAFQSQPSVFAKYRTLIFSHQTEINVANVREKLLDYGEQVGLNRLKLAACLDSKASLPRVESGMREGQKLEVASTPTFFINGQMVVGPGNPQTFYNLIDEDLRHDKQVARR